MAEPALWGCLECGTLSHATTEQGRCTGCGTGLVTRLGGAPTPEKAQALIAWARRDATAQLEARGTLAGGAAGAAGAVGLGWALGAGGVPLLVLLTWAAVLGGLLGHLAALPVHRRVRPNSRLQPVVDPVTRQRLIWFAWALWALGLAGVVLFEVAGGDGAMFRRLVGKVWALLGG